MNLAYRKKYLKYKKKYERVYDILYTRNIQKGGAKENIKYVASYLLHEDDTGTQILLLQRKSDDKWMTPGGHIEKKDYLKYESDEDAQLNALKREFYEETGFEMPKIQNLKTYVYNETKLYIGYVGHIDMGEFRSNNEAHSIGLFNIDMFRKHNYSIATIPLVSYVKNSLIELDKKKLL